MSDPDPNPIYSAMLRETLSERLHPDAHSYVEMLAEGGVVAFPYAIPGLPQRVEGRAALAAHLERIAAMIEFTHFADIVEHETSDPEVVILELSGIGRSIESGEPYEQRMSRSLQSETVTSFSTRIIGIQSPRSARFAGRRSWSFRCREHSLNSGDTGLVDCALSGEAPTSASRTL